MIIPPAPAGGASPEGISMIKDLSIRKKMFLLFWSMFFLLTVVGGVGIWTAGTMQSNSAFVKESALRQAVLIVEFEGQLTTMLNLLSKAADAGATADMKRARALREKLETTWAAAEPAFSHSEGMLTSYLEVKEKIDAAFRFGQDLFQLTINKSEAEIGAASDRFTASKEGLVRLLAHIREESSGEFDKTLLSNVRLAENTIAIIAITMVIALVSGIALTLLVSSSLLRPIRRLTDSTSEIARGNLTRDVQIEGADEIGALADAFNTMTRGLRQMLGKIADMFRTMSDASGNLTQSSHIIVKTSTEASNAADTAYRHVDEVKRAVEAISGSMHDFAKTTEEIESWILEMSSSISEAAEHAEILSTSANQTSSSIHELSASIGEVADYSGNLLELQEEASSSIGAISGSIREVESITHTSADLTKKVNRLTAEGGMDAVTKAVAGMYAIRDHVNESADVIQQLGSSLENIGKIVRVIDSIAEKTKLLSLNASILAAQSGEQGKGFTVVAEEIGDLSENTIRSTKEIADLVNTIKKESRRAIDSMGESSQITEDGVTLTKKVEQILGEISAAAASSHELSQRIVQFSEEQAKSAGHVLSSIQNVTSMSGSISKAASAQAAGVGLIVKASEHMQEISQVSKRATEEQSLTSKRVAQTVDRALSRSKEILHSVKKNSTEHESLIRSLGEIQQNAKRSRDAVSQVNAAVKALTGHTETLKEELNKFRF
ncbi:MAG TPA: hypothetical protein DCO77_10865 [Nitrospiraceae bacterium]|nr:hypothetical protein [Nitrospiraceae bacterium]